MDQTLTQLSLSPNECVTLPTSLHVIYSKPVGDLEVTDRRRFQLCKYGGTKVLNLGGNKPISKINLE